ncbi:hypothetical protein Dimus_004866 [Dionaea muscipula]
MEESATNQQSSPANLSAASAVKSKLRYPLRSSMKPKQDKSPDLPVSSSLSAATRGRSAAVSHSVNAVDHSRKEKSVNPPRRLSIHAKSVASSPRINISSTSPSETSVRNSVIIQGKSNTPLSDISKSSSRMRFSVVSSASYWLSQIKLSESAGKHSISLGFFKLALDAGSEPLHLLRDELKCYVRKHGLTEVGETVTAVFESYGLSESLEQLQISDTCCSQAVGDGTQSSDQVILSSSPSAGTGTKKLRPKSLNIEASQVSSAKELSKQTVPKNVPAAKTRDSATRSSCNLKPSAESEGHKVWKRVQKPSKQEPKSGQVKVKKQQKEPVGEQVEPVDMDTTVDDKENMDVCPVEVAVIVTEGN